MLDIGIMFLALPCLVLYSLFQNDGLPSFKGVWQGTWLVGLLMFSFG